MTLAECSYSKVSGIYKKYFSLGFLNTDIENKLALIALICNVTDRINSKKKSYSDFISCYDVICRIGKDMPDEIHQDFFKSLGAICDDMMYGCSKFPDFGIDPKDIPKTIKKLLDSYIPF